MSDHIERTGLAKYDAMQSAILACVRADEAKDIRDQAVALEKYAQQARNFDAERRAAQIRIRAETQTGLLLKKQEKAKPIPKGAKRNGSGGKVIESSGTTQLKDLGISKDQSSRWQKLAENPKAVERYLKEEQDVPTTTGALAAVSPPKPAPPPKIEVPDDVIWLWGRLGELQKANLRPKKIADSCDDKFARDLAKSLDVVLPLLQQLRGLLK